MALPQSERSDSFKSAARKVVVAVHGVPTRRPDESPLCDGSPLTFLTLQARYMKRATAHKRKCRLPWWRFQLLEGQALTSVASDSRTSSYETTMRSWWGVGLQPYFIP